MVVRRGVVLLALLAFGSCDDGKAGPPLSPTTNRPVQGTYTLTVSTSPSCPVQGSWTYRADIEQSGWSLEVRVYDLNGELPCGENRESLCDYCFTLFRGTVDGLGRVVLDSGFCVWKLRVGATIAAGSDQARGMYQNGRIDALFDGDLGYSSTGKRVDEIRCSSFDHPLTFVRR